MSYRPVVSMRYTFLAHAHITTFELNSNFVWGMNSFDFVTYTAAKKEATNEKNYCIINKWRY